MSWDKHHSSSEKLASDAESALRAGDLALASMLYKQAASEEAAAFDALASDKNRTKGITAVSAVALNYKARDYVVAEKLAHRYLASSELTNFAENQLRNLLHSIWSSNAAERAGVKFVAGDVLVSVKGGQVVYGGAPLDLIVRKVGGIQSVLFRTVEMMLDKPFRKRGGPPSDIQSMFRPWLFQAPAGSYQFAVRMQEPDQAGLFDDDRPRIEGVTAKFFSVLRAASRDPEGELPVVVPDAEYRSAFLSLSRDLAPAGRTFESIELRDASTASEPLVTFGATTRQELSEALRKMKPKARSTDEAIDISGTLRALHLDEDWLEVVTNDASPIHIVGATDALDDVVGPMVNRRVIVSVVRRGSKTVYRDIELDE